MTRLRVRLYGRVQGVGFRYRAAERAMDLGLTGWVRNLPDGSVEVEAQGPSEQLRQFLDWLGHGPPAARVSRVVESGRAAESGEAEFRIF